MLIEQRITENGVETYDKVAESIRYLQSFEPADGYYLAFSGGKDSCVLKALADMAGVKYDAHYSVTSVDPPELVRFIRDKHPDVVFDVPHDVTIDEAGNEKEYAVTMWNLIPRKAMPPTRLVRYCCEALKENNGERRVVLTGVRKAESARREKTRELVHIGNSAKTSRKFSTDNGESVELVWQCYKKAKVTINPMIYWTDDDVWEFIHFYNVSYCELYDIGYKRLGCVGCPMSSHAAEEIERYPKLKEAYLRAFGRMIEARKQRGLAVKTKCDWSTPEKVMEWWLQKAKADTDGGQISMFDDVAEEELYESEL